MQKKLKWNAIGLETKTRLLLDDLTRVKQAIDPTHAAKIKKVEGLIAELGNVVGKIEQVKATIIPKVEALFRVQLKTPELMYLALSRPGLKTIYDNIRLYYQNREQQPLKQEDFVELSASGDAGNVLALIGDAAISLAIVETLWDSSLARVGNLSKARSKFASNENLSRLCQDLHLHENRLDRLQEPTKDSAKEETIIHEKGTLVEAILGVIYLELGFDELARIIPFLQ